MEMFGHCSASILLLFGLLSGSAPTPVLQMETYEDAFNLTRTTKVLVKQVLKSYTRQQLGDEDFEDRSRQLRDLPELSMEFYSWRQLTDWERLQRALTDMQAYWNRLEWSRTQLEKESKSTDASLPDGIRHIQLDLRDLMVEVISQMSRLNSSWIKPTVPAAVKPLRRATQDWDRRVEGYVVLRDLSLYLIRLARDFLLLESQTQAAQSQDADH
ncbi:uncharacterized protein LOC128748100 [Synchiropus splendidus]|uniref:uncharacterized protein LOC128748100 n=1 Tax=Synchiropus splendidus TaxID=270530 RepID=UPI00237D3D0D|nr:uncharacterized protein LOC128748100 [Synchiropus splendidus]